MSMPTGGEPERPDGPYRGLAPFGDDELDSLLFFGREREREVIAANLMASPLTILYGPSGAGKTSVLRAGVAHDLRQAARGRANGGVPDLAVAVVDAWRDDPVEAVLDSVRGELAAAAGEDVADAARGAGSLTSALTAWTLALEGDLYVVLDQFDEYLLYHETEDGEGSLVQELPKALSQPGLRVGFLVCLREDQLARLDRFKGRIPGLFGNSLRLDRLGRDAARAAILGPLERYAGLDETAARAPRSRSSSTPCSTRSRRPKADRATRSRLPISSSSCSASGMPRRRPAPTSSGSRPCAALGGAGRVVHGHLEEAMATLDPAQQDIAASVFNHLVTPSGTKIAHGVADLAAYASVPESDLVPVLSTLAGVRILRPGGRCGRERRDAVRDLPRRPRRACQRLAALTCRGETPARGASVRLTQAAPPAAGARGGVAVRTRDRRRPRDLRAHAAQRGARAGGARGAPPSGGGKEEVEAARGGRGPGHRDAGSSRGPRLRRPRPRLRLALANARGLAALALTQLSILPGRRGSEARAARRGAVRHGADAGAAHVPDASSSCRATDPSTSPSTTPPDRAS